MTDFAEYLALYEIDLVGLSIEAHVRYGTVYNAKKGYPLMPENAKKIKDAVYRLTGVAYTGSFTLIELNDRFPLLHVKQLPNPRNHQQHS